MLTRFPDSRSLWDDWLIRKLLPENHILLAIDQHIDFLSWKKKPAICIVSIMAVPPMRLNSSCVCCFSRTSTTCQTYGLQRSCGTTCCIVPLPTFSG
ncbi:hypothetical protein TC41_1432 [Alicyclobacillus acidocaldarius subsp. acidocaldarius Tc-4-1]|uniref:Uncharacterized protein n=1 Tax=Alicyclobacillus acidocaldarius (strain Tc-4-1) TaxID=1048834 RepID=F8IIN6_ALIAT|nr:hypothetical protein TC41_1432 [Alicyclobacillus acidocaldarius subsp. acidocaldarius Tc-4-1]